MELVGSGRLVISGPLPGAEALLKRSQLHAVELSTVTFIAVAPLPHDSFCVLVDCCPDAQLALSVVIKQF
jgi:hypothetical protein